MLSVGGGNVRASVIITDTAKHGTGHGTIVFQGSTLLRVIVNVRATMHLAAAVRPKKRRRRRIKRRGRRV